MQAAGETPAPTKTLVWTIGEKSIRLRHATKNTSRQAAKHLARALPATQRCLNPKNDGDESAFQAYRMQRFLEAGENIRAQMEELLTKEQRKAAEEEKAVLTNWFLNLLFSLLISFLIGTPVRERNYLPAFLCVSASLRFNFPISHWRNDESTVVTNVMTSTIGLRASKS